MLRSSSIEIKDVHTGTTVEPTIQRLLNLRNPHVVRGQPNSEFGVDGHDLSSAKEEIKEIKRALQPLATRSHLGQELSSMKNTIADNSTSLQVEFGAKWDKHEKILSILESKLDNARQDLEEFRTLLENAQTSAKAALSASDTNTAEIAALKAELRHLYQALPPSQPQRSPSTGLLVAPRELDILTRNITKIGNRASQVETLQMEFELLKSRVERIEGQTSATSHNESIIGVQQREPQHSELTNAKHRASTSCDTEDGINYIVASPGTSNVTDDYIHW